MLGKLKISFVESLGWSADEEPTPEIRLWAAVLERAISDLSPNTITARHQMRESAAWFRSNRTSTASFCWVCDMLNRSPTSIRAMIAAKIDFAAGKRTTKRANRSFRSL